MGTQPYSAGNGEATAAPRPNFRRSAIATVLLVISLSLFIRAGVWQLDRAGQKEDLQAEFSAGSIVDVLRKPADSSAASELRFRRFELQGRYEPDRQVLLDNMVSDGQVGYQVLTPFRTGARLVLVNRGWVKANPDRTVLPDVTVGDAPRTIVGRLNMLPEPGVRLDPVPDDNVTWPRRMLYPDQQALSTAIGSEVTDYQLWLDADQPDGFERAWKSAGTGPETHYGYAFQWFAFAGLALVLYIIFNLRWVREHAHEKKLHNEQ